MNARDKELWGKSQQWDSSDDGRGKLKILESVEKFADLIRADEREACAQECEGWTLLPGGYRVTLEEAKRTLAATIAKRIRARGNT